MSLGREHSGTEILIVALIALIVVGFVVAGVWDAVTCTEYGTRMVEQTTCQDVGTTLVNCTTREVPENYCISRE